ncbi:MAG TPA: isochorismatase family protein [Nitrososphaerales archaeon]|nr:isochorismatase family protein [Nitrososphaerales archaeon]
MKNSRIWDAFLTNQDRALELARPPKQISYGNVPVLLLVDLYRSVFGDKPQPLLESVKNWPNSCGLAGWNAIPHISKLLKAAREEKMPVVYVTGLYEEESGVRGWSDRGSGSRIGNVRSKGIPNKFRYEIIDELKPISGEAVLRKSAPSAFWGTPLVAHLNSLGVDTVIIAGESTSGCVRATVVDGRTLAYHMIVVEECVFDRTESSHAINLFDMNQKYAPVVTLSEALKYMRSHTKKLNRSS